MRAIVCGVLLSVFLVLFTCTRISDAAETAAEEMVMMPMVEAENMLMSRRKLGSFQICALCTCCGGGRSGSGSGSYCVATPCCYAINCNIPNRPFGYCSFTPKTCNCFGCHI